MKLAERFGLTDLNDANSLIQLRVVDPSGESLNEIRRRRTSYLKAYDLLSAALKSLNEGWRSDAVFHRIIDFTLDGNEALVEPMTIALSKMEVSNETLSQLDSLLSSKHGFSLAIEVIVKVGTSQARGMLSEIAHRIDGDAQKAGLLGDAALAISVKLNDCRVIPMLVNRLVRAYKDNEEVQWKAVCKFQKRFAQPAEVVTDLLAVIRHCRPNLSAELLQQLAGLGMVHHAPDENTKLGTRQAIITKDLKPIREEATKELQRRTA